MMKESAALWSSTTTPTEQFPQFPYKPDNTTTITKLSKPGTDNKFGQPCAQKPADPACSLLYAIYYIYISRKKINMAVDWRTIHRISDFVRKNYKDSFRVFCDLLQYQKHLYI